MAKHVEFYSKNKFEKLVHLVGFIIRIYHDVRSSECHISYGRKEVLVVRSQHLTATAVVKPKCLYIMFQKISLIK